MRSLQCVVPDNQANEIALSSILANAGIASAQMAIVIILIWLACRSVVLRRSVVMYSFMGLFSAATLDRLVSILHTPAWLHQICDFTTAMITIMAAIIVYRQRFNLLSTVYKYEYTVGLLGNLERIDGDNEI